MGCDRQVRRHLLCVPANRDCGRHRARTVHMEWTAQTWRALTCALRSAERGSLPSQRFERHTPSAFSSLTVSRREYYG